MELNQARTIAENMIKTLTMSSTPACERIEIAGSVRRGSPDVHDIELVAIPIQKPPSLVFGQPAFKTSLDKVLWGLERSGLIEPVKGGDKYKQFWIMKGGVHIIKVDLFLVTPPAQWGVQMVIRTGPNKPENNFSQWVVTHKSKGGALPDAFFVENGAVWNAGLEVIVTPEEQDFFALCGLTWMEPGERVAKWRR